MLHLPRGKKIEEHGYRSVLFTSIVQYIEKPVDVKSKHMAEEGHGLGVLTIVANHLFSPHLSYSSLNFLFSKRHWFGLNDLQVVSSDTM